MAFEQPPADLISLEKILHWMQSQGVPHDQIDLIQQDEFCFDFLVPWKGQWLVFGLT